ncbi:MULTISPECIES: LysE family transporter [Cupriavidus]|jgi:threonine/homoserine/homoserine lactone efflux protein|uniref:LysE family translocator n=1 Tax=Cupriavidus sp. RAF20_2 TaxID=3233053 RepID=UPI003F8EB9EA
MHLFLIVATAHFLALLSPGPDFFLIARTSLAAGWRRAAGACLGIALANGVFIAGAFAGVSAMRADSALFSLTQLAGGLYLLYLGWQFVRFAGTTPLGEAKAGGGAATGFAQAVASGFLSGILNPKNALFYASLAAMLSGPHASAPWKVAYGVWMFAAVLGWDLLVAVSIGHPRVLRRFARALPKLERAAGGMLMVFGAGVLVAVGRRAVGAVQRL